MAETAKRSQDFVPVKEVKNGVIILKTGEYRGVLMCSSVNFSLKSEDEQHAMISGFQTFLNTIDFSVQIVIHSRKLDIRPYLTYLNEHVASQKTELMRIQMREYIKYIEKLTEDTNIMTKTFYLIVPYSPTTSFKTSALKSLFGGFGGNKETKTKTEEDSFDEHRAQLEQRMAVAAGGLQASGVRAVPLGTEEIIELLYRTFNPGEQENPIKLES
jgi:hypothetical protein